MKITVWGLLAALLAVPSAQAQVYYRLETGYSQSFGADFRDKDPDNGLICGDPGCFTAGHFDDLGSSGILGAGVGYRFNPGFRGDITLGYRPGYRLDSMDRFAVPARFTADVKSTALMANGYFDMPLPGWTPYFGGGFGYAQNKIGTLSFNDGGSFVGTAPGGKKSNIAWDFMFGAAFPVSDSLAFELGYRYIDLGRVESDPGTVVIGGVAVPGYAGTTGRLQANEIYFSVRF